MAEPGPDCGTLLDEALSSFVFNYLADSQVGRAAVRCGAGGPDAEPRGAARAPRGTRGCTAGCAGAILGEGVCEAAPHRAAASPAPAFSTTRTWTPGPPPPRARGANGKPALQPLRPRERGGGERRGGCGGLRGGGDKSRAAG